MVAGCGTGGTEFVGYVGCEIDERWERRVVLCCGGVGEAVSGKGCEGFLDSINPNPNPEEKQVTTLGDMQSISPNTFFKSGHSNSLHNQHPPLSTWELNIRSPIIPQRRIENM